MKPKEYDVLTMAVEQGVACGWRRAHKHVPPTPEAIQESVAHEVINAICEWFDFEAPPTEDA